MNAPLYAVPIPIIPHILNACQYSSLCSITLRSSLASLDTHAQCMPLNMYRYRFRFALCSPGYLIPSPYPIFLLRFISFFVYLLLPLFPFFLSSPGLLNSFLSLSLSDLFSLSLSIDYFCSRFSLAPTCLSKKIPTNPHSILFLPIVFIYNAGKKNELCIRSSSK